MEKKYIIKLDDNKLAYTAIIIDGVPYIKPLQLLPYTEPDLEQVREEAYRQGYDTGYGTKVNEFYEQGLIDAWEAARWLVKNNAGVNFKVFGMYFTTDIFCNISASECIEKIRRYEQEKKEQDGLRQNIQTIVDQCGYTLDEIAEVLQKMREG